jgi:hypothetical protein
MRWPLKLLVSVSALLAAGLSLLVYTTLWGKPLWFDVLLDRQAATIALQQPEILTQFGLAGADWFDISGGEFGGFSLVGRSGKYLQLRRFRSEIAQWNSAKHSPGERTAHDMLLWSYDRRLADEKYPWLGADGELYPVNQAFGVQKFLPSFLLTEHPIRSARSAQNYVSRLEAIGPLLDAVGADIRRQANLGVVAPDFIIEDSITQMNELIAAPPASNVLVTNLADKTAAIGLDPALRLSLVRAATAALRDNVYPSFRRLIAEEHALHALAGHDAGLWRLKNGEAYYADQLKSLTSTDMAPGEINQYALSEVNRISNQMDTVLKSIGLRDGTVGARMQMLAAEPRFHYPNTEDGRRQMLLRYKQILEHVRSLVPAYFAHVPTIELDVRRMPTFAERGAAGRISRQYAQSLRSANVGDADIGLSRRRSRPPSSDRDGPRELRTSDPAAHAVFASLRRRLGSVFGVLGRRDGALQERSVWNAWATSVGIVPREPPGRRYGHPCQTLVARTRHRIHGVDDGHGAFGSRFRG